MPRKERHTADIIVTWQVVVVFTALMIIFGLIAASIQENPDTHAALDKVQVAVRDQMNWFILPPCVGAIGIACAARLLRARSSTESWHVFTRIGTALAVVTVALLTTAILCFTARFQTFGLTPFALPIGLYFYGLVRLADAMSAFDQ